MKSCMQWMLLAVALSPLACEPGAAGGLLGGPSEPVDGEGWSILLYSFEGPGHVVAAQKCKAGVDREAGWRNVFIFSNADSSQVLWNIYGKPEEAQKDVQTARNWVTSARNKPFPQAMIVRRPTPNPGKPEHDLVNVLGRYPAGTPMQKLPCYSVVVAEFFNTREFHDRKKYAVDYCEELRRQGHEAYYHHGPTVSKVSIGTFLSSAFTQVEENGMTVSVPTDPAMKAVIAKFPYLAVDGYQEYRTVINPVTRKPEKKVTSSYVDYIPTGRTQAPAAPAYRPGDPQPR